MSFNILDDIHEDVIIGGATDVCDAPPSTPVERTALVGQAMRKAGHSIAHIASWRDEEPRCGRPLAAHTPDEASTCGHRSQTYGRYLAERARIQATVSGSTPPGHITGAGKSRGAMYPPGASPADRKRTATTAARRTQPSTKGAV